MFEVIDPVLKIESCNLSDLTIEEVNSFLGQWEKGAKISSLTGFYKGDGTFVLNKDYPNYQEILEFCKHYMTAAEKEKQQIRENEDQANWMPELALVMDNCLKSRYIAEEMKVINLLPIPIQAEIDILQAMYNKFYQNHKDVRFILSLAYMYGKVQGKREERARRKKNPKDIKGKIIKNVQETQYSKSLEQLLVLSKILSKKCRDVEYSESLSWKEQVIGFIIDDLMNCKEQHLDIAYGFINALSSK